MAWGNTASRSGGSSTGPTETHYGFQFLLLLSGFCGISYEILYGRILSNFIGDQFAVSASVLLTFLLGIGVGTLYAHRFCHFLWLIEASIGVCGVVIAVGASHLDSGLYAAARLGSGLTGAIVVCFLVLSIPAFLIGCSVPLFAGYLSQMNSGRVFARAYCVYNIGAAAMALLIEFWFLRIFGIRNTVLIIAGINAAVSISLLLGYRQFLNSPRPVVNYIRFPSSQLGALAVASIASAIFQLLMVKLAECVLGPFRETFALILALILLGIALGSEFAERFRTDFGRLMLGALASLAWLMGGFGWIANLYASFHPIAVQNPVLIVLLKLGMLTFLMGAPAVFFGATIPALLAQQKDVARESGRLLFTSSIANALGFLLMAFILHQYFDYGILIVLIAGLTAFAAVIYGRFDRMSLLGSVSLLIMVIVFHRFIWDENLLYIGQTSFHSRAELSEARAELRFSEKFKGYQDVFSLTHTGDNTQFFINGYVSISLKSPAEKIVGAFPALFAPRTDQALVLGLGSGATGGTVALLFDRTDAVEINPVVVQNLHRMAEYNFDVQSRRGVQIFIDDGIHFAKSSIKQYSLIINTVTSPLYFSSSKLYTYEFFESVRRLLATDGIYVTWIDSRIGDRGMDIILKTLGQSFRYCWIAAIKTTYFLLMCSQDPIALRQPKLIPEDSVLADYFFAKNGLRPEWIPYGLLSTQVLKLGGDPHAPVNTLDYPVLEFEIARLGRRGFDGFKRRLLNSMSLDDIATALKPIEIDPIHLALHADLLLGDSAVARRWKDLASHNVAEFETHFARERLQYYAEHAASTKTAPAYRRYGSILLALDRHIEAIQQFRTALVLDPNTDNAYFNIGSAYEKSGQLEAALENYAAELKVDPSDHDVAYRQGRVLYKLKRYEEALVYLNTAAKRHPTSETEFYRALSLEALNRVSDARKAYEQVLSLNSAHRAARDALARLRVTPDYLH